MTELTIKIYKWSDGEYSLYIDGVCVLEQIKDFKDIHNEIKLYERLRFKESVK